MKEKLKSRKFWVTILSEIAALAVGFGLSDDPRVQLASVIVAALIGCNYVRCQTRIEECIKDKCIRYEKGGYKNYGE